MNVAGKHFGKRVLRIEVVDKQFEDVLGYEWIEVHGFSLHVDLSGTPKAWIGCDVITNCPGHNTMGWQDIADAIANGTYRLIDSDGQ